MAVIRLPAPRKHKRRVWTVDEARRFLESARHDDEPLYTAYVLIVVLGLRKGEVLGLAWDRVDLDTAELYVGEQLQRVKGQLIRRQVKTESSEAPLPLPELCVTALKLRTNAVSRPSAGRRYMDRNRTGLHYSPWHADGAPQLRSQLRPPYRQGGCAQDHQAQHPEDMGSLLAALDVHPRVAMQILRHSQSPSRWRSTPKYPRLLPGGAQKTRTVARGHGD